MTQSGWMGSAVVLPMTMSLTTTTTICSASFRLLPLGHSHSTYFISAMSRTLCLLFTLIAFTNAFYLGNYYVGSMPYRFLDAQYERNRLGFEPLRGIGREVGIDNPTLELQKDKKDSAPMKRFKPCYYSPIQCLIKRR